MPAGILHADLDAFYASVEQLLDPTLRGRPIAVGGGVVLAASYEAKAYGVQSGMSGWRASQLCPHLRFVGGHFRDYQRLADQVMAVFEDFTPLIERISIDEAFLDVCGSVHLFGAPADMAARIRTRVRNEIGLAVSIGVARTKHLAKVASQVAKPDGLVVVEPEREGEFLDPLPVGLIWGVGPVTHERLVGMGIRTIGELATAPTSAVGQKLADLARNIDSRAVESSHTASSVGAQSALGRRPATPDLLRATLSFLADRVTARLRAVQRAGRTLTVRVRFAGMRSVTRSITFPVALSSTITVADVAVGLAETALADHPGEREISLLAISLSNLVREPALQLELPLGFDEVIPRPGGARGAARWAVDRSIDRVRSRFGRDAVGYARVVFSDFGRVPDEFRELAERPLRET